MKLDTYRFITRDLARIVEAYHGRDSLYRSSIIVRQAIWTHELYTCAELDDESILSHCEVCRGRISGDWLEVSVISDRSDNLKDCVICDFTGCQVGE
jgi:hypothetical protein